MYYQWTNQNDFDTWHNALCESLNYPEIVNGKVITDSYTMGFEYKGVWIAYVEEQYNEGLTPIIYKPEVEPLDN